MDAGHMETSSLDLSRVKWSKTTAWAGYSNEDPLAQPPVEGGPKTAEVPEDVIPESRLLEELDISTNLSPDQRQKIQHILIKHKGVFGLDGRLGN